MTVWEKVLLDVYQWGWVFWLTCLIVIALWAAAALLRIASWKITQENERLGRENHNKLAKRHLRYGPKTYPTGKIFDETCYYDFDDNQPPNFQDKPRR